jgi:hypothetical protein
MVSRKRMPRSPRSPKSEPRAPRSSLNEVILHLRQIRAAVALSVAALKYQNSDLDEDIASVLQRGVGDRLQEQIDRLEVLSRAPPSPGRRSGYN